MKKLTYEENTFCFAEDNINHADIFTQKSHSHFRQMDQWLEVGCADRMLRSSPIEHERYLYMR